MKLTIPLVTAITAASMFISLPASLAHASIRSEQLPAAVETQAEAEANPYALRIELYNKLNVLTDIPWYWIAAIDQYERTISKVKPKSRPPLGSTVGVFIDQERWAGILNPDAQDSSPLSIRFFDGIGRDADGDGQAERTSDVDLLYSLVNRISAYGATDDDIAIGLWQYYQNNRSVQRVQQFARIYAKFGKLDLFEHAFPVPVGNNYAYKSTWGTGRSWGGRRTHEGTDIFANHGLPVRSTCYGVVEVKGWNPFGGWRIGIRDLNNFYHYYAHLSGYDKTVNVGDIVKPGQIVGWVGSSGYGKPGTQGKFPPHLHYGVYSDRGLFEWSFDPYPMLKRWEQAELKRLGARN